MLQGISMYIYVYTLWAEDNDTSCRACRVVDASWHMNGRADAGLDNMYRPGHGENKWLNGYISSPLDKHDSGLFATLKYNKNHAIFVHSVNITQMSVPWSGI